MKQSGKRIYNILFAPEYRKAEEVCKAYNGRALQVFSVAALALLLEKAVANFIQQRVPAGILDLVCLVWILACTLFYRRRSASLRYRSEILLLYLMVLPVLIESIYTGAVLNNGMQTFNFFLLSLLPMIFITDVPLRMHVLLTALYAVYIAVVHYTESGNILRLDLTHAAGCYLIVVVVLYFLAGLRRSSVKQIVRLEELAETDSLTGLKNSTALRIGFRKLTEKPMLVIGVVPNHLRMMIDILGTEASLPLLEFYGKTLEETFGRENVIYHRDCSATVYLADFPECLSSLPCSAELAAAEAGAAGVTVEADGAGKTDAAGAPAAASADVARLSRSLALVFQEKLRKSAADAGASTEVSVSFGYVTGFAENLSDLEAFSRTAYLYARSLQRADHEGISLKIAGGPYTADARQKLTAQIFTAVDDPSAVDPQTGLLKFGPFLDSIALVRQNVIAEKREQRKAAILFFDVDQFKRYNRDFGYGAGDLLIEKMAGVLKGAFPGCAVCHSTGDHFLVFCPAESVEQSTRDLSETLSEKAGQIVRVRIGGAHFRDGDKPAGACDEAKAACDSLRGTDRLFAWFDGAVQAEKDFADYLSEHVEEAAEKGWIIPYYQPIVKAEDGSRVALEALARWKDPEKGFLSPGQFIPPLEQRKQTHYVDLAILRAVVQDMAAAEERGLPDCPAPVVSVNFSRNDMIRMDLPATVDKIVREAGISPSRIAVEITEEDLTRHTADITTAIEAFHARGFRVWMDDFGSGYSSLSLLQDVHFDLIKMDLLFMRNLGDDPAKREIVRDIIRMIRHMNAVSLCEGCETQEQYEFLKDAGISLIQGYYFGKPSPAEKF